MKRTEFCTRSFLRVTKLFIFIQCWKDRTVRVTSCINEIGCDNLKQPFVRLNTSEVKGWNALFANNQNWKPKASYGVICN